MTAAERSSRLHATPQTAFLECGKGAPPDGALAGNPGATDHDGRDRARPVRRVTWAARGAVSWQVMVDDVPAALGAGGRLAAVAGVAGTAWVLDVAGGLPAATLSLPGGILDLAFSPDGSHLVLTGTQGYALWHADDGRATVLHTGRRSARARWAEPGRVAVADGHTAVVLDAAGRQLWRTAELPGTVTDLAWLPGGRLTVACDNEISCHERHLPGPVASLSLPGSRLTIAVPPDGRWICAGGQDGPIHSWRISDAAGHTLYASSGKTAGLAFDATGRWLAVGASPQVTVWDFAGSEPQGLAPRTLCAHDTVTALAWRPGSGTILATAGAEGTIALWNATAGKPGHARITTAGWRLKDAIAAVAWNGPGMLLAATRNGTVRALDPNSTDPAVY